MPNLWTLLRSVPEAFEIIYLGISKDPMESQVTIIPLDGYRNYDLLGAYCESLGVK